MNNNNEVKNIQVNKNLEIFFFDLDAFYSEQGLDWNMVFTAAALCRLGGQKLSIFSSRSPSQIMQIVRELKCEDSWQDNAKELIKRLQSISLSDITSNIISCGVIVDHISLPGGLTSLHGDLDENSRASYFDQVQLENDLIRFLQKSLSQSNDQSDIVKFIEAHPVYKAFEKANKRKEEAKEFNCFSALVKVYQEKSKREGSSISAIRLVGPENLGVNKFNELIPESITSNIYFYNDPNKQEANKKIRRDIFLDVKVAEYLKKTESGKVHFIRLLEYYLKNNIAIVPEQLEIELVKDLLDTISDQADLMKIEHLSSFINVLSLRLPHYANQLIIKITYSQYPLSKKNSAYEIIAEHEIMDDAVVVKSASEASLSSGSSHDNNNNNDSSVRVEYRKSEQKHGQTACLKVTNPAWSHFQFQEITTFNPEDYGGVDVEDFLERGRNLIKVALGVLEKEEKSLLKEDSNLTVKAQLIFSRKESLRKLLGRYEKIILKWWKFSDEDFRNKDGFFGPSDETKEKFKKFYSKTLRLLRHLTKMIASIMIGNDDLLTAALLKEYIEKLEAAESKYVESAGRPLLLHKMPLELRPNESLPFPIEQSRSSFWHMHVSVGRYTHQQMVHLYFEALRELASKASFDHKAFNMQLHLCLQGGIKFPKLFRPILMDISKSPSRNAIETLEYVISNVVKNLKIESETQEAYQHKLNLVYEAISLVMIDCLKVSREYTSPSTERAKEGYPNFIETSGFYCDGTLFHALIAAFRSSSATPIFIDPKLPAGESITRLLVTMRNIEQEVAVYTQKLLKQGGVFGTGEFNKPYFIPIAWASLLSPLGGAGLSETITKAVGKAKESEHRQLYEVDKVRKMVESGPMSIEVEGRQVWVQVDIQSINVPVNESSLRWATKTFSDLHEIVNAEGLFKLAYSVDDQISKLINEFDDQVEVFSELKAVFRNIKMDKKLGTLHLAIKQKQSDLKALYASWRKELESLKLQLLLPGFAVPSGVAKKLEKIKTQIKNLEGDLTKNCAAFLDLRARHFFDFEPSLDTAITTKLNNLRDDDQYKNNPRFKKLADIFELQTHVFRMHKQEKWNHDEYCYWFVSYFICLQKTLNPFIIIRWHCKSGEDRTGVLEDYLRAIEIVSILYGHYLDWRQDAATFFVNLVRQQLYEMGVCRITNGYNAPGSGALQVANQTIISSKDFDLLIAGLAKKVFVLPDGDLVFPMVIYEMPIILNKARAKYSLDRNALLKKDLIIAANNEFRRPITLEELRKDFASIDSKNKRDVFYHDLTLRFWYYVFEIANLGYDAALLKDMEFFRQKQRQFTDKERTLLVKFFNDKCSAMWEKKSTLKNQFSILMQFIETLKDQDKSHFLSLFEKSLFGNISSYSYQVAIELLKEKCASGSPAEVRYVLPWFYQTGKKSVQDYNCLTKELNVVLDGFSSPDKIKLEPVIQDILQAASEIDSILIMSKNSKDEEDEAIQNAGSLAQLDKQFIKLKTELVNKCTDLQKIIQNLQNDNKHVSVSYLFSLSVTIGDVLTKLIASGQSVHSDYAVSSTAKKGQRSKDTWIKEIINQTNELVVAINKLQKEHNIIAETFELNIDKNSITLHGTFNGLLRVICESLFVVLDVADPSYKHKISALSINMDKLSSSSLTRCENSLKWFQAVLPPDTDYSPDSDQRLLIKAMNKLPSAESYGLVDFFEVMTVSEIMNQSNSMSGNKNSLMSSSASNSSLSSVSSTKSEPTDPNAVQMITLE